MGGILRLTQVDHYFDFWKGLKGIKFIFSLIYSSIFDQFRFKFDCLGGGHDCFSLLFFWWPGGQNTGTVHREGLATEANVARSLTVHPGMARYLIMIISPS